MAKAKVVSVGSLSRSINSAVKLAAKRHGAKLEGKSVLRDWEILGRILREGPVNGRPIDLAVTIASGAKLSGIPVAAKIGKDILVGVIPFERNFNLPF